MTDAVMRHFCTLVLGRLSLVAPAAASLTFTNASTATRWIAAVPVAEGCVFTSAQISLSLQGENK